MGKFKKGDEVRLIKSEDYNGHGRYGKTGEIGTVIRYDAIDHTYYVDFTESGQWWAKASNLEPSAATLKIEAGRFYKTRDGRKVGPMIEDKWHDRDYGWTVEHEFNAEYGKAWRADGTFHVDRSKKHSADLIAEWIDEPVVAKPKPSNDNAQPKLKVGDLIRHKTLKYEGVVKEVVDQRTVRTHWTKEGWGATDPIDCIELITPPTPTTAIVALIENGQPKPSSTPHVHASTGAAEKEAKRLAAKYKGKQFGVFTLTTTHEEAAPVYDHKWQNMAALGLKSDAIASLKAQAGITTDQARRIVYAFAA
ncbi:hypothetical protein [Agrobacterium pusense]|uniref:hypothetical protein n=1 Tax=Agrobacterium pusense TaxID=648995 RepID=UPI002F418F6A